MDENDKRLDEKCKGRQELYSRQKPVELERLIKAVLNALNKRSYDRKIRLRKKNILCAKGFFRVIVFRSVNKNLRRYLK